MNVLVSLIPIIFDSGQVSIVHDNFEFYSVELKEDKQPLEMCKEICEILNLYYDWLDIQFVGLYNSGGTLRIIYTAFLPKSYYEQTENITSEFNKFSETDQEIIQYGFSSLRKI